MKQYMDVLQATLTVMELLENFIGFSNIYFRHFSSLIRLQIELNKKPIRLNQLF